MSKSYKTVVGKLIGKKSLARSRRRCEGNINMGHNNVGCEGVCWIEVTDDKIGQWWPLVITALNFRVP
jgi:hypothetical protein